MKNRMMVHMMPEATVAAMDYMAADRDWKIAYDLCDVDGDRESVIICCDWMNEEIDKKDEAFYRFYHVFKVMQFDIRNEYYTSRMKALLKDMGIRR